MFNLVIESRVHSSLHQKSHHQIIYAKLNLKIHYLPPDERDTWHYRYVNNDLIQREIIYYPREKFLAEKDVNEIIYVFAKSIKNIFPNFVAHETMLCDDRDPTWISSKTKKLINDKKYYIPIPYLKR